MTESNRQTIYQEVTDRIIRELEQGRVPWVQPWGGAEVATPLGLPKNAATGNTYSGINILILWGAAIEHGRRTQSWLTFKQAKTLGGSVRRGERGTTVVYADRFIPKTEQARAQAASRVPRTPSPQAPTQSVPAGGNPNKSPRPRPNAATAVLEFSPPF